jgi:ABC-type nickel/cobalt efflux system permease component RcnA/TolB-like protein
MGDGVNIAARLEGACKPGAICLSEDAYRQVKGPLDLAVTDLGSTQLKNIAEPIRVYSLEVGQPARPNPASAPAPERSIPPRLSIVVLPFANIGGDPEQEHFVDGVTESLTTDLSRIRGAVVVARNSAFAFKGKPLDVKTIGRELNVRHVLVGSVQRATNRMRVNVQLVDAETGNHLWAERFDKPLADLFDMQDEIVARLANALNTELVAAEARRAEQAPNPDSMDLYFQGLAWINKGMGPDNVARARSLFDRALSADPDNVDALIGSARADARAGAFLYSTDPITAFAAAEAKLAKALSSVPDHARAHLYMGIVDIYTKRAAEGIVWISLGCAAWSAPALAQLSPRPFAVAGGEGGGGAEGGVTGWLMAEQSWLTHLIATKVHALHGQPSAAWGLIGLGFAYGVVHAAGPGHGKAVLASYMVANETSLKRGAVMALMAALLQALIAIGLVGAAGFVFRATGSQMNQAADWIALASYCSVAAIGAWLVWRKGGAFIAALSRHADRNRAMASAPAYAGVEWRRPAFSLSAAAYRAGPPGATGGPVDACGHAHAPDAAKLNGPFSWRAAVGTVIAAGARPCSGAILVLVFAMAQGLFAAGVAAALAMAIGTAVATGALAWTAVFAKSAAMRLAAGENSRLALVARGFEFAAAVAVLLLGVALLMGARGAA